MTYTRLVPQQAKKIASINGQMCALKEAITSLSEIVTNISGDTTQRQRTPNYIRATAAGVIVPVTYDVSIANVGLADGIVLGVRIEPGEVLSFNAGGLNNTYAGNVFSYDATGTELMIIYNT